MIGRVVSALAATYGLPPEPLSPELVLVSPPEIAHTARLLLPERPAPAVGRQIVRLPVSELTAVWLFCLTMTVGPLLFLLAIRS
jgi:hypothetical protein